MNDLSTALEQLRDVHLPPDPGFWPPAPGWWVVFGLLLVGVSVAIWQFWRRYHLRRWRQKVLTMLDELMESQRGGASPALITGEVSMLLRRVALGAHGRENVAGLTGESWLAFLDRTGGEGQFGAGPGQVLATGPYARIQELDADGLHDLARRWLQQNLPQVEWLDSSVASHGRPL
jgi:hypothetical protein